MYATMHVLFLNDELYIKINTKYTLKISKLVSPYIESILKVTCGRDAPINIRVSSRHLTFYVSQINHRW